MFKGGQSFLQPGTKKGTRGPPHHKYSAEELAIGFTLAQPLVRHLSLQLRQIDLVGDGQGDGRMSREAMHYQISRVQQDKSP